VEVVLELRVQQRKTRPCDIAAVPVSRRSAALPALSFTIHTQLPYGPEIVAVGTGHVHRRQFALMLLETVVKPDEWRCYCSTNAEYRKTEEDGPAEFCDERSK